MISPTEQQGLDAGTSSRAQQIAHISPSGNSLKLATFAEGEPGQSVLLVVMDIWRQVPDIIMLIQSVSEVRRTQRCGTSCHPPATPRSPQASWVHPRISPTVARPKPDDFTPKLAGWVGKTGSRTAVDAASDE